MEASVLIVSRNRYIELRKTLEILQKYIDRSSHEILVFLDGCTDGSEKLREVFPNVKWEISAITVGASKARSILYKKARGKILFGFDDDSHPLQPDFIKIAIKLFSENGKIGIIAFKEIKGRFANDEDIPLNLKEKKEDYLVKDFLGCGFAIRKDIYDKTRGFPVWIDIYGEEVCVALETLEMGYEILFTHQIIINHRTDKQKKNIDGANYFRFGKQLKNTASFYMVYYPFPLVLKKVGRLYFLNFRKYAIKDFWFFKEYFKALGINILNVKNIYSYRKPVSRETIKKFNRLSNPLY
jgi:GT2 family glycosyltransferase